MSITITKTYLMGEAWEASDALGENILSRLEEVFERASEDDFLNARDQRFILRQLERSDLLDEWDEEDREILEKLRTLLEDDEEDEAWTLLAPLLVRYDLVAVDDPLPEVEISESLDDDKYLATKHPLDGPLDDPLDNIAPLKTPEPLAVRYAPQNQGPTAGADETSEFINPAENPTVQFQVVPVQVAPAEDLLHPGDFLNFIKGEVAELERRLNQASSAEHNELLNPFWVRLIKLGRRIQHWEGQLEKAGPDRQLRPLAEQSRTIGIQLLFQSLLRLSADIFSLPWPVYPALPAVASEPNPNLVNYDVGFGATLALRPHQISAFHRMTGHLRAIKGRGLPQQFLDDVLVMPVGAGKTRLMIALMALAVREELFVPGDVMLMISHTDQIYEQNRREVSRLGHYFRQKFGRDPVLAEYRGEQKNCQGDVILVSLGSVKSGHQLAFFLRQLQRRLDGGRLDGGRLGYGKIAVVNLDESHHLGNSLDTNRKSWLRLMHGLRHVSPFFLRLGATATPSGREGNVLFAYNEAEMIQRGLGPQTYYRPVPGINLSRVKSRKGGDDFDNDTILSVFLDHPERNTGWLRELTRYAYRQDKLSPSGKSHPKPVVIFGNDLAHSAMMAVQYADHFSAQSDSDLGSRKLLVLGQNRGRIDAGQLAKAIQLYRNAQIDGIVAVVSGETALNQRIIKLVEAGLIEAMFSVDKYMEGSDLHMFFHQVGARASFSLTLKGQERGRINRGQGPKILFDVIDNYSGPDHRQLATYGTVIGISDELQTGGFAGLFDIRRQILVDEQDQPLDPTRADPTRATTSKSEKSVALTKLSRTLQEFRDQLQAILSIHYGDDRAALAEDLSLSEEVLAQLLAGSGWLFQGPQVRRLIALFGQGGRFFTDLHQKQAPVGNAVVTEGNRSELAQALQLVLQLATATGQSGELRVDSPFAHIDGTTTISLSALRSFRDNDLTGIDYQKLCLPVIWYLYRARPSDPRVQPVLDSLVEHLVKHHFPVATDTGMKAKLLFHARALAVLFFGGAPPAKLECLPASDPDAPADLHDRKTFFLLKRWLQDGWSVNDHKLFAAIRAWLRFGGLESSHIDELLVHCVFLEMNRWPLQAITRMEQVLVTARKVMACMYGPNLPSLIKLPAPLRGLGLHNVERKVQKNQLAIWLYYGTFPSIKKWAEFLAEFMTQIRTFLTLGIYHGIISETEYLDALAILDEEVAEKGWPAQDDSFDFRQIESLKPKQRAPQLTSPGGRSAVSPKPSVGTAMMTTTRPNTLVAGLTRTGVPGPYLPRIPFTHLPISPRRPSITPQTLRQPGLLWRHHSVLRPRG